MDGTLLDSTGRLHPDFFSVFENLKDKGITFVAASGRQYYNLLKVSSINSIYPLVSDSRTL